MKKFVLIVLAMGLIFGVTFITQFTGSETRKNDENLDEAGKEFLAAEVMPLVFASAIAKYDPNSSSLEERYFKGFYEKGDDKGRAYYWFYNPHKIPIDFQFNGFSCSICTHADIAVITRETLAQTLAMSAIPLFPAGLSPVPTLLPTIASVQMSKSLRWQPIGRDEKDIVIPIPAAESKAEPVWGVLRIAFKALELGPRNPSAQFLGQAKGSKKPVVFPFGVSFVCVEPFDIMPKFVNVGEQPEGASPYKFDLYYWSQVRAEADFRTPVITPSIANDPFVQVGKPVLLTEGEKDALTAKLGSEKKDPSKVLAAYRVPIAILREVPGKLPDIGPYEKELNVLGPSEASPKVIIRGKVIGIVTVEEGETIDLKTYDGRYGTIAKTSLVSNRADLELELVTGEIKPSFLQVTMDNPKTDGGQKTWAIKMSIPANQGFQSNWTGVIVLQTKGPSSQKIRIPVKGNGTIRGK